MPDAEKLANNFDDKYTLVVEDAMQSAENVTEKLNDYQRLDEISLTDNATMYRYEFDVEYADTNQEVSNRDNNSSMDFPQQMLENHESSCITTDKMSKSQHDSSAIDETLKAGITDAANYKALHVPIHLTRPLLRSADQGGETSDRDRDYDYSSNDEKTKTIQVGSEHQAIIPEGLSKYDDAPAYENEDKLIWDPTKLSDEEVEDYLRQSSFTKAGNNTVNSIPSGGCHLRDDEQALFLLLQSGHNKEQALRRLHMNALTQADAMSPWSEDECRRFETGLRAYGKNFHLIQMNQVRTRSVGELVNFYYLWKKTERHDILVTENRTEKTKYTLHPGSTDYMDWFLDEQENSSNVRVN